MTRICAGRWTRIAVILVATFLFVPTTGRTADAEAGVAATVESLQGIRIGDGERVVLAPDDRGPPKVIARGPAGDKALAHPFINDTRVETTFRLPAPPISAAADTLIATFRSFGPQGATLKVENGFSHPMLYDASIITRRGQDLVVSRTSICPVAARAAGVETWGGHIEAIILSNPREPSRDDMHCSGDSGLIAGGPPAQPNVCLGGADDSPIQVRLFVDPSTGDRLGAAATWTLRDPSAGEMAPVLMLDFPMQNEQVAGRPTSASIIAIASLDPPPKSKTASIVILADGVEAARRPWGLYTQRLASAGQAPAGSRPVAFVGAIPFPLYSKDASPDLKLATLYAGIGDGRVRQLDIRVQGDDGALLSHAAYSLSSEDIRNTAVVTAALHEADGKRAATGHCARPPDPASKP